MSQSRRTRSLTGAFSPTDNRARPGHARTEAGQEHEVTVAESIRAHGVDPREGDRGRSRLKFASLRFRRIAKLYDTVVSKVEF